MEGRSPSRRRLLFEQPPDEKETKRNTIVAEAFANDFVITGEQPTKESENQRAMTEETQERRQARPGTAFEKSNLVYGH